jgi:hypothetical protein
MQYTSRPTARHEALIVCELRDEVLVYDLKSSRAHCLNQTAAFVWKSSDGRNTLNDISRKYLDEYQGFLSDDIILMALHQLSERHLLVGDIEPIEGRSRREALKKISFAATAILPIVASISAPVAAQSSSSCFNPTCTCSLVATCTAPGGCVCSQQSTCPAACINGCACVVVTGGSSCNSTCRT